MKPVRLGVIGCGVVASSAHAPAWLRIGGWKVKSVCDLDTLTAENLAARLSAGTVPSWEVLVADPDIQAIAVLTPPHLRTAPIEAALAAGKAVFVENPLSLDAAECREIGRSVETHHGKLMMGFNLRWHPHVLEARRFIRDSQQPAKIRSWFFTAPPEDLPDGHGRKSSAPLGSYFFDLATHHIDLFQYLTGDAITGISATTMNKDDDHSTGAAIRLKSASGHESEIRIGYTRQAAHGLDVRCGPLQQKSNFYKPFLSKGNSAASPAWLLAQARCLGHALTHAGKGGIFRASYTAQWQAFLRCVRTADTNEIPGWKEGTLATELAQIAMAQTR